MKKLAITFTLLNIFYECSASSTVARQAALQLSSKSLPRSYSNLADSPQAISLAGMKPATRNKIVRAQEQAREAEKAQAIADRQAQINMMNKEFQAQPAYSYDNVTPPIATAPKAPVISNFSAFDKNYLGGAFAAIAGLFGYDTLKSIKDNQLIEDKKSLEISEAIPTIEQDINSIPADTESIETALKNTMTNNLDENYTDLSINQALQNHDFSHEEQTITSEQSPMFANWTMQNLYASPKEALLNVYNNPTRENVLLALQNPVVGASVVATALGGYGYYQYLKYLERIKAAEKAKAALEQERA